MPSGEGDAMSMALREAWGSRVLFKNDDLKTAADKMGMHLGVPDWFVGQLPKNALAALNGHSVRSPNPKP